MFHHLGTRSALLDFDNVRTQTHSSRVQCSDYYYIGIMMSSYSSPLAPRLRLILHSFIPSS